MGNKKSNAPGFGSGNGSLKKVALKTKKRVQILLPKVPRKSY